MVPPHACRAAGAVPGILNYVRDAGLDLSSPETLAEMQAAGVVASAVSVFDLPHTCPSPYLTTCPHG